MADFTQPEPINHNELKRLLCEIVDEILDETWPAPVQMFDLGGYRKEQFKKRMFNKIENAILDGDDS